MGGGRRGAHGEGGPGARRAGVARVMGSCMTASKWKQIVPVQTSARAGGGGASATAPAAARGGPRKRKRAKTSDDVAATQADLATASPVLRMGLTGRLYAMSPTAVEALRPLVDAVARCQDRWRTVLDTDDVDVALSGIFAIIEILQTETGFFSDEVTGYIRSFLARKIVIARAMTTEEPALKVNWAVVPRAWLAQMCSDESGYLDCFPAGMPASEISELVFERPDLGLFVSMWGVLVEGRRLPQHQDC